MLTKKRKGQKRRKLNSRIANSMLLAFYLLFYTKVVYNIGYEGKICDC